MRVACHSFRFESGLPSTHGQCLFTLHKTHGSYHEAGLSQSLASSGQSANPQGIFDDCPALASLHSPTSAEIESCKDCQSPWDRPPNILGCSIRHFFPYITLDSCQAYLTFQTMTVNIGALCRLAMHFPPCFFLCPCRQIASFDHLYVRSTTAGATVFAGHNPID